MPELIATYFLESGQKVDWEMEDIRVVVQCMFFSGPLHSSSTLVLKRLITESLIHKIDP